MTPSRRVNISKPDGGTRPIGVVAIEDKIVRKAVTEIILTPIYEAEFPGFSCGFRLARGAHDALHALAVGITRRKTNWVVESRRHGGWRVAGRSAGNAARFSGDTLNAKGNFQFKRQIVAWRDRSETNVAPCSKAKLQKDHST